MQSIGSLPTGPEGPEMGAGNPVRTPHHLSCPSLPLGWALVGDRSWKESWAFSSWRLLQWKGRLRNTCRAPCSSHNETNNRSLGRELSLSPHPAPCSSSVLINDVQGTPKCQGPLPGWVFTCSSKMEENNTLVLYDLWGLQTQTNRVEQRE